MYLKGLLLFAACIFLAGPLRSQYRNIKLDDHAGGSPDVAIDPRHPDNIVAGTSGGDLYASSDGGQTWEKVKLSLVSGVYSALAIVADQKGTFYSLYGSGSMDGTGEGTAVRDRIAIQRSEDGGATWHAGDAIFFENSGQPGRPAATLDGRGTLFVAWTDFDRTGASDSGCQSRVLFTMSRNAKKWSDPVTISQPSGSCLNDDNTPGGAVPAVSHDGKVFVAWASNEKIFLDRSFNGGERWLSNDIVVAEQPGGWDLRVPGHERCNGMPVLACDNSKTPFRGSLYLVWADQRNGEDDTDIWFTRSHNFGDNWALPLRVNDDGKGRHQYLPSMAVDPATGYIYLVYYDRRNYDDEQTDVYLAYSTDGGTSFKNVKVSEQPFIPQDDRPFGDYTHLAAQDGRVVPVWTRMDDGATSVWTAVIRHEDLPR